MVSIKLHFSWNLFLLVFSIVWRLVMLCFYGMSCWPTSIILRRWQIFPMHAFGVWLLSKHINRLLFMFLPMLKWLSFLICRFPKSLVDNPTNFHSIGRIHEAMLSFVPENNIVLIRYQEMIFEFSRVPLQINQILSWRVLLSKRHLLMSDHRRRAKLPVFEKS